jgi:hypothetical protein
MEADQDGIMSCPVCGHVQEPDPLDNPDLGMARDVDLRQNVTEDVTQQGEPSAPASDPLDTVEFSRSPQVAARKADITDEGISEMFTTKLRTTSKEEADKLLPAKVARLETKLGATGITRGHYKAAHDAGISVKVSYPDAIDADSTLTVPGNDGIFNLFYAEEAASKLKVPMSEVPIVIEGSPADVEKFQEILTTVVPKTAAKEKTPVLAEEAKPSDEPKEEKVVQDAKEPVESKTAVVLEDGKVELDGRKYRLVAEEEEEGSEDAEGEEEEANEEEPEAEKKEEPKVDEAPFEEESKKDSETDDDDKTAEDREAKLLAAFALADLSVEMGIVDVNDKMAFIAELEKQSMDAIAAREATLKSVKTAGLTKQNSTKTPAGIRRVPRLAHRATPHLAANSNGSAPNGTEDLFLLGQ